MNSGKVLLSAFIIVALAQLFIPAKMIMDIGKTNKTGIEYKLRVIPPQPRELNSSSDRMITNRTGRFYVNSVTFNDGIEFTQGQSVFVYFTEGDDGFAKVTSVTTDRNYLDKNFINAEVDYMFPDSLNKMLAAYPFERYFLDETGKSEVRNSYRETLKDTTNTVYALINVAEGSFAFRGVYINGVRLSEYAKGEKNRVK